MKQTNRKLLFDRVGLICLLLAGTLMGCGKSPARLNKKSDMDIPNSPKASLEKREAGTWKETFTGGGPGGTDMLYTIHVPEGLKEGEQPALVFALHFGGRVTPHYGKGVIDALIQPGLAELGAIIVAPDSIKGGWNSDENQQAVKSLYKAVVKAYSIDEKRTVVSGFSMGGHGAFYYGINHPEMFQAAIPIAGDPGTQADEAELKIPIYIIHSKRDDVVNIGPARKFAKAQKAKNADVTFVELEELTHYQTPAYAEPLREAVAWVKQVWESQ